MYFQVLNYSMFKYVSFQEYDVKSKAYSGTLNDDNDDEEDDHDDEPILKRRQTSTMAQAVQRKVQ